MKLLIPMAGLIDKEAELKRLDKEIERLSGDVTRTEGKLANPAFVDKAPAAVVDKERVKLAESAAATPPSDTPVRWSSRPRPTSLSKSVRFYLTTTNCTQRLQADLLAR